MKDVLYFGLAAAVFAVALSVTPTTDEWLGIALALIGFLSFAIVSAVTVAFYHVYCSWEYQERLREYDEFEYADDPYAEVISHKDGKRL